MKATFLRIRPLATAIIATLFLPVALHGQTATTVPVGFITVTLPAAIDANTPSSSAVSVPLYKPADFAGAVASVDSTNQITLVGAAFTANQFASPSAPRLVRVKTSATASHIGKMFVVTANTTNQLTVDLTGTGVVNVGDAITAGATPDTVEILPANTIGSVFGNATTPPTLAAGTGANTADNVLLWNGSTWDAYFWTGTATTPNNIWKRTGNTDRANTIIYPDDGVFLVRRAITGPVSITFMGTVPSTSEQSGIPSGSTFLANRFPVNTTLGGLGLHTLPGWTAGTSANNADSVYVWNTVSGAWDAYFWTGTATTPNNIWKRTGNTDRSNTPILAGTAIYITHAGTNLNLTQVLPYTP